MNSSFSTDLGYSRLRESFLAEGYSRNYRFEYNERPFK